MVNLMATDRPSLRIGLFFATAFCCLASFAEEPVRKAPVAAKIPHQAEAHGQKISDPYYWLREKENPKVKAYLRAENDYADKMMSHTQELRESLIDEMTARLEETDTDVPVHWGPYVYYTRTEEEEDYSIHCRKMGENGEEEIVLNENILAAGHDYFELGAMAISPNQQLVAYGIDTNGTERYTLRIKDIKRQKLLNESIPNVSTALAWGSDNKSLFYAVLDDTNRPHRVYRHTIGEDTQRDVLVYEEKDEAIYLYPGNTKSQEYVFLTFERNNHVAEVRYLKADKPTGEFKILRAREPGLEYQAEHAGDKFYIVTNDGAFNSRLVSAPIDDPRKENWKDVLPHRDDAKLESLDAFENYIVVQERTGGVPNFRIVELQSGQNHALQFPDPAYTLELGENIEFKSTKLRFKYSSLLTPEQVFDYDLATRKRELKKEQKVLGGFDRKQYVMEKTEATAADGTKIPIYLVAKKGFKQDGDSPLLLYGYGAYGISEDPYFSIATISLLDRGFIYAVAHIRGGGELGRKWYEEGKLLKKKNSFTDFITAAEHLVKAKYTSPKRMAISGASAGGLLVGAVVNARPDLFQAAIADVPFVDVLNTMLDPSLPLTVTEYQEWGNPQQKEYFDYIRSYAPYENIKPQAYPHMLIKGGLNDTRVAYWEPAKWAAKLRATKTDSNMLLLKTNLGGGHGGVSGRYQTIDDVAFDYAFLIDRLGINK